MPVQKGTTYATGNQVTATNLNNLVDNATFTSSAVDNVTTQLSSGAIIVKDGGITPAKLSTGKPSWDSVGNLSLDGTSGYVSFVANGVSGGAFEIQKGGVDYGTLYGDDTNTVLDSGTSPNLLLLVGGVTKVSLNSSGMNGVIGATTPAAGAFTTLSATGAVTFTTPLGLAGGGTGKALSDPGADRILFWDDSAGETTWLTVGSNLSITGTTLNAASGGGGTIGGSTGGTTERILVADGTGGSTLKASGVTIDSSNNVTGAATYDAGTGGYKVSGTKVVGAQGSAIADATITGSYLGSDTVDEFSIATDMAELRDKINAIVAAMETHGLIAS